MTGTEFADKLKASATKELQGWEIDISRSLLANKDAISTVLNALHLNEKNPRKSISYMDARKFSSGTVCEINGPVPDARVAKTRGAKITIILYLNPERCPDLMVYINAAGKNYYSEQVPVKKIKDIHKFVHDFIDSRFNENGLTPWEDDYVTKKLRGITAYCEKHGITVTGSLGFSREK